ncbi:acyl-CoA thioesterase [Desulfospira joergensenii]|uniref:acyl-CoA thioesterase n=1 Tax=Desulfospira joergensenii TaxID=53329 RepID=UPI0003B76CE8|nr:acyl-CoA thioesterase [Desulfospira joergensenii]
MKSIINITVRGYHIDQFGHVNHGRYVELLEEARWCYLEEKNLFEPIHEIGLIHVVSRLEIDYRHPARVNDTLRFETKVTGRTDFEFLMNQDIFLKSSEKLVIHARIFNVFVDQHGKAKTIDHQILDLWPDLANAEKISHF